ncbi:IclR family transcriptional regulator [Variovorax terrae]|uniref:IclR family transcriptional regulator n=1 Tax=Variovorax terrae TaxID=2923278 RepID=A0A9X1VWS2_9BURK|nr:IclR family transcriptional regulator [Variovorax terrae]MCJ0764385.1 IclR family transcriptional regulator [Variovorax terrae]
MSTQTLDRAIGLLHLLAAAPQGCRLVDLQRQTGLTKPTVHRILETLCQHQMAAQDPASRRYRLGPEIALLAGAVAPPPYDLREVCADHMIEVAQRSGDTSFLTVRSGFDAVCIDRQSGPYPVKAFTVDVGTRRPLGVGAGGIMLLAMLDEEDRAGVYKATRQALPAGGAVTMKAIVAAVEEARRQGHAYSDGLVLGGVRGLAVPILAPDGKAVAALSLAAIRDRITRQRIPQLLSILKTHAASIEQRLRAATPAARR